VGGGYWRRIIIYFLVSIEFSVYATVQVMLMLHKDRQLFKLKTLRSGLSFWFGRHGVLWHTLPHWLAYFKPGFHPWQHDNRDLLARWQNEQAEAYRSLNTSTAAPQQRSA
jgi:predicted metal-dependent hydrolase